MALIELDISRNEHIVISYGYMMTEFHRLMKEEVFRDEVLEECYAKMMALTEEKLKLVQSVQKRVFYTRSSLPLTSFITGDPRKD